jgi:mannose-1-phosphate guanylyltransferase
MNMEHLFLVILAGGSGTRLWPLSRRNFPKQFLKVGSDLSLVRQTVLRMSPPVPWKRVLIVSAESHGPLIRREFPELAEDQFLLEPVGKNTAAAIALAAREALRRDRSAILAIFPADHKIPAEDLPLFREVVESAVQYTEKKGGLLTLGIHPTHPATGYGYLQRGEKIREGKHPVHRVLSFREKPDLPTAKSYLKNGGYDWNSGLFVWKASEYERAYRQFLPQDARAFDRLEDPAGSPAGKRSLSEIYPRLTSISVDYAILEKADGVAVIPAAFRWDDVGSLASLARYFPKDSDANAVGGRAVVRDAKGNLIVSDQGIVACLGVEGIIVIRSGDAVLVLPKERSEEVKHLLEEIQKRGEDEFL